MKSFDSFLGLAEQFVGMAAQEAVFQHEMLEGAAKIIERTAKAKIGEYQDKAGQFVAWAELADSTKRDRVAQGYPEDEPGLRSGEMGDSIEHNVTPFEAHVGSNNDKLVWFELGTDKQPPRSVLGGAAFEKAPEIVAKIGGEVTLFLAGKQVFQKKMLIEQE